jgi:hypothetical protein
MTDELGVPQVVDRSRFQAELDALRVREKAHTHEGDLIAAARHRLPMVEMDPSITLIGPNGPLTLLDAFEGRRRSLRTISCGTPAIRRRSSARGAPGLPHKSGSCPIFILVTPHLLCFVRVPTRRAPGTATSWAGRCPGTSFATCGKDPKCLRPTG